MASEVTEQPSCVMDIEAQKLNIMRIIEYQKSRYYYSSSSSSSSSSTGASCSSFSSPRKSSSLLDLMKEGSTSLGRLFDMEHISLETYLRDYSGSPMIKPIFLWGSDSDDGIHDDPWTSIKPFRAMFGYSSDGQSVLASENSLTNGKKSIKQTKFSRIGNRRLARTKSFRRLPRFRIWICGCLQFRLRLRRLRIIICGRKF